MIIDNYIRLPLRNAYNVRELGGYARKNGKATKWRSFLRADDLSALDEEEIKLLKNYGVKTVIDLRSSDECETNPDPFEKVEEIKYINISLIEDVVADATRFTSEMIAGNEVNFISSLYLKLISNSSDAIKDVLAAMANADEGGILFHCAAGKDRTGVISMLLLGLAEVSIQDIISNYETTFTNLRRNPVISETMNQYPMELMHSKAEYIEAPINYIIDNHGTVRQYLSFIGLTDTELEKLESKL